MCDSCWTDPLKSPAPLRSRACGLLVMWLGVMLTFTGCQKENRPSNMPRLFPMTVTVLQAGKPLPGAFVRFVPDQQGMPWSCGGTTDESGNAVIRTSGEFQGAPSGQYKAIISKLEIPEKSDNSLSNLSASSASKSSDSVNLVDPVYSSAETSTLVVVVEEGKRQMTFDVGPEIRTVIKGPH